MKRFLILSALLLTWFAQNVWAQTPTPSPSASGSASPSPSPSSSPSPSASPSPSPTSLIKCCVSAYRVQICGNGQVWDGAPVQSAQLSTPGHSQWGPEAYCRPRGNGIESWCGNGTWEEVEALPDNTYDCNSTTTAIDFKVFHRFISYGEMTCSQCEQLSNPVTGPGDIYLRDMINQEDSQQEF